MRIDKYLAEVFGSRTKAARAIREGRVKINGKQAAASDEVRDGDLVETENKEVSFVSEGGFKLYKALCDFNESAEGLVFADIGASTGGFTDCLLQRGALRVYAVDVGESQLAESLKTDARVTVKDGVNARYLRGEDFPEQLDGVTADVSFISLKLILPSVARILGKKGKAFVLIKPQFECGAKALDKHGIVKRAEDREQALLSVCEYAKDCGLFLFGLTNAPLKPRKNVEFVALLKKDSVGAMSGREIAEKCKILSEL